MSANDPVAPAWPDWRDAEQYRHMLDLDRAGWAWEWLRRNPDYVEDSQGDATPDPYRKARPRSAIPHLSIHQAAPRWGLCFR